MVKWATYRTPWLALVVLGLGCGGKVEEQRSERMGGGEAVSGAASIEAGGVAGSDSGGSPAGVGRIDSAGLPAELPIDCAGMRSPTHLALPCKVGRPRYSGDDTNLLECYYPDGSPAFDNTIPFGNLATLLNQPLELDSFPPTPGAAGFLALRGTVVFTQVDPVGRAFVARLRGAQMIGTGPKGEPIMCTIPDAPFWAVAGEFI